jgi:hypothetical protein
MKKLNTTYLDNLVSKILKETLEEKADSLVSKIKEGNMCECGGTMYEGECNECGSKGGDMYEEDEPSFTDKAVDFAGKAVTFAAENPELVAAVMAEDIYDVDEKLDDTFDYVTKNESMDEDRKKTCLYHIENFEKGDPIIKEMCQGVNINEALKGRQRKLDKNKNNKIDAEDFKMLRKGKKSETDEGNAFSGALSKAKKSGEDSFEVDGKEYPVKESYRLTETEMISLIEKIVKEEKDKNKTNIKVVGGSPKGLEKYKQIHAKDGKENDDNIKAVAKKMKEYLKDGSKGDYDMNPKMFPKGNGELEKMKKKAYTMSDAGKEFIDDFMSPGMEVLEYDQIEPNEDQITANIEGSSKTGNDSSYANAVETDVNKKVNAKRKANKFAKARAMAYNKAPQPVKDYTGEESGKGVNIKLESTEKKTKQINEEFDRIKSLMGYNQKTQ